MGKQLREKGVSSAIVIAIAVIIAAVAAGVYFLAGGTGGEGGENEEVGPPASTPSPPYEVIATVDCIFDGDTIGVNIDNLIIPRTGVSENTWECVRFAGGIDAPEKPGSPKAPEGEEGWQESMELVENLVPLGTTVYLDLDDNQEQNPSSQGPFRGVFGRLIAVIYVKVDGQWVNVNAELLRWGLEEYPDQNWLRFTYFISEFDANEWLEENYLYILS